MPIGFGVAALVMIGAAEAAPASQALVVGVLLVGIPALDTCLVILSRRRRGISILTGGRDHLTHRTRRQLGTARAVAMSLGAVQALVAALALFALRGGASLSRPDRRPVLRRGRDRDRAARGRRARARADLRGGAARGSPWPPPRCSDGLSARIATVCALVGSRGHRGGGEPVRVRLLLARQVGADRDRPARGDDRDGDRALEAPVAPRAGGPPSRSAGSRSGPSCSNDGRRPSSRRRSTRNRQIVLAATFATALLLVRSELSRGLACRRPAGRSGRCHGLRAVAPQPSTRARRPCCKAAASTGRSATSTAWASSSSWASGSASRSSSAARRCSRRSGSAARR